MLNKILSIVFLLVLASSAGAKVYSIGPKNTDVGFSIVKFKIGKPVEGHFDKFSGTVEVDEKTDKITRIKTSIRTPSINTEKKKRDKHLRSEDFFFVEKYPKMEFVSTKSVAMSESFELPGKLTIRGITKPVVLEVEKTDQGELKAFTKINRLDFGVSWNKTMEKSDWSVVFGMLGKVVLDETVKIHIQTRLE
mgnify:CR=1 FL=1